MYDGGMTEIVPLSESTVPASTAPALPTARPASLNPYLVYINRLSSPESRRTMATCLRRVATLITGEDSADPADIPWEHIRYQHVQAIRTRLMECSSPATVNKHLVALRGVLAEAWRLGLMNSEEYHRAVDVKGVKAYRLPAGRSIAKGEMAAMLRACQDGTLRGVRDAAIIAVLASTGMRRAEIASARRADYNPGDRCLRIIGKGDKQREVFLNEEAAAYLGAWLARTEEIDGPIFCPINKWGKPVGRHMTPTAVAQVIDTVRRRAQLPKLTTHDFRRTFIGDLLDAGVDLATAQALAGHSSSATTARYDRRPSATRKAAVDKLRLPRPEEL